MVDPLTSSAAKQIVSTFSAAFDSPTKEIGNYIADKIRYLRYKSLLKIVSAAEEKAKEQGLSLKMPPLKFFVPFCEAASLEGGNASEESDKAIVNDEIKNLWSNLLIKAGHDQDSTHSLFVRILKEITINEVEFLKRLVEKNRATAHWRGSHFAYEDASIISPKHFCHFAEQVSFLKDDQISQLVIDCFEGPGYRFYDVMTGVGIPYGQNEETSYILDKNYHTKSRVSAHVVLISLGLIKEFDDKEMYFDGDRYISVSGVTLTEMGIEFLKTCSDFKNRCYPTLNLEINYESQTVSFVPRT